MRTLPLIFYISSITMFQVSTTPNLFYVYLPLPKHCSIPVFSYTHTTANHTPFQAIFCFVFSCKLWKYTTYISYLLRHFTDKEQVWGCLFFFSCTLHTLSLLHRFSVVGTVLRIIFHLKYNGFNGLFKFQKYVNTLLFSLTESRLKILYVDLTVKILSLSPLYSYSSTLLVLRLIFTIISNNYFYIIFQTNLSLLQGNFSSIY